MSDGGHGARLSRPAWYEDDLSLSAQKVQAKLLHGDREFHEPQQLRHRTGNLLCCVANERGHRVVYVADIAQVNKARFPQDRRGVGIGASKG